MRQEFHGLKNAVLLALATSFLFLSCDSSNTTTQREFKIYSDFAPDYVLQGKSFFLKSAYDFGSGQPYPIKFEWTSQPEITINNTPSNPFIASGSIPDTFTAPLVNITAHVKSGEKVYSYTKVIKVIQKNTVKIDVYQNSPDLTSVTEPASSALATLPLKNGFFAWGIADDTARNQVLRAIRYDSNFKPVSSFGTAGVINLPPRGSGLGKFEIKAFADAQENLYLAYFDPVLNFDPFTNTYNPESTTKHLKISKFDTNGQPVATFGSNGFAEIPYVYPKSQYEYPTNLTSLIKNSVFLGEDDYIYVVRKGNLLRYSTKTGSLDTLFGAEGQYSLVAGFKPNCLATDSQGRVIIAGDFFRGDYALRYPMAIRIEKTGIIDTSFAKKGILEVVPPDIYARNAFGTFKNVSTRANDSLMFTEITGLNPESLKYYAPVLSQFKSNGTPDLAFASEGRAVIGGALEGLTVLGSAEYTEFTDFSLQVLNEKIYIFNQFQVIEFNSSGALTKHLDVIYAYFPKNWPRNIGTAVKISSDKSLIVFGVLCAAFYSTCDNTYSYASIRF
jgi:hypothetical protein